MSTDTLDIDLRPRRKPIHEGRRSLYDTPSLLSKSVMRRAVAVAAPSGRIAPGAMDATVAMVISSAGEAGIAALEAAIARYRARQAKGTTRAPEAPVKEEAEEAQTTDEEEAQAISDVEQRMRGLTDGQ